MRGYNTKRPTTAKQCSTTVKRAQHSARVMQSSVRTAITQHIKIKHSMSTSADGQEIGHNNFGHNNFVVCDSNLLKTAPGVFSGNSGVGNRIGYKITLSGFSVKGMIEVNARYISVTCSHCVSAICIYI